MSETQVDQHLCRHGKYASEHSCDDLLDHRHRLADERERRSPTNGSVDPTSPSAQCRGEGRGGAVSERGES